MAEIQALKAPPRRQTTTAAAAEGGILALIRELFPREASTPIKYRRRTYIYQQGDAVDAIYCLTTGMVALERIDEDGRMVMFGVMNAGAILGWQDMVEGGFHRNGAQTLSACEAVVVPCRAFQAALREDERLVSALMRQTAAQVGAYEDHIMRLSTLDVPERLYFTLCGLAGTNPGSSDTVEFSTPLRKRDLAAMVGTSPETISRSLRRLEELDVAEFTDKDTVCLHPRRQR